MRRFLVLALSVALVALAFVPTAMAQTNYQGGGNQGMNSRGMDNNMGMDDNMMASPASSASATAMSGATASPTASATASPSASPSASPTASASASASASSATSSAAPSKELPDTGGIPLVSFLSVGGLVLLAGSGVFAARLTR